MKNKSIIFIIIIALLCTLMCGIVFAACDITGGDNTEDETPVDGKPIGSGNKLPSGDTNTDKDQETGDSSKLLNEEKQSIINGSSYYGVGRTINVIEDEFINVPSGYGKIFDTQKLLAKNWRKAKVGKMTVNSESGSSISELYNRLNAQYGLALSAGVNVNIFSAGIDSGFRFAADSSYKNTANEIYCNYSQIYGSTLVEIDEFYNLNQFKDILSSSVLADAEAVQSGTMSAQNFINKYGTHVVLAGYYGGKLEFNYYLRNIGEQWNEKKAIEFESIVKSELKGIFSAGVSTDFSMENQKELHNDKTTHVFMASAIGGANFKAGTPNDFWDNYGDWVQSMNNPKEEGVIVDLPKRSLAAIWDLFPDDFSTAKGILNNWFEQKAQDVSSEFLKKYERLYNAPEVEPDKGNTDDFAGGSGTKADPYLISEKTHFKNIQNKPSSYYKLINSVNLGIWNSPFAFKGNLDGNGNVIIYNQTISDKSDFCSGLFTELNDASICNLQLDVAISRDLDRGDKGIVGGLAGIMTGISKISKVSVSGRIYVGNHSGNDYVGGLIGKLLSGSIEECMNNAEITDSARYARTGGIAGFASPANYPISITNCYNVGHLVSASAFLSPNGLRVSGGIIGQVEGNKTFDTIIGNCFNDGELELKWTKNSSGGTAGCAGIYGHIGSNRTSNINVSDCYWNTTKCKRTGNNTNAHKDNGKTDMRGVYQNWSSEIWKFSNEDIPRLIWMLK